MIGERIIDVLAPKGDSWFVVKTNLRNYFLKLGGIAVAEEWDSGDYESVIMPLTDSLVSKVYSDDFSVYLETEAGEAIHHSPNASIDGDGNTSFGLFFLGVNEFSQLKMECVDCWTLIYIE